MRGDVFRGCVEKGESCLLSLLHDKGKSLLSAP